MEELPSSRTARRNGQAMSIAGQIIQASSIENIAISAKEIYHIVINNKRMSNKGEFSLNTEQSWRKFLSIGYSRSLWDRKRITVTGYTGSNYIYYYYYRFHVDEETMTYGNHRKWTRNAKGDYVPEKAVLNSQHTDDIGSE